MNEQSSFARVVADSVATAGVPAPSEHAIEQTISRAGQKRQRPRWLAFIKEPPMRIASSVAVGSPTVRVAAILVATLLVTLMLAGAGIAGSRLLAADGAIVVDPSGNGTVETIAEAVALAKDGDTILVKPGTYTESITITQDITVRGDGPREEIVIEAAESPAFLFDDTEATLSNMTLRGEPSRILIRAGVPVLEDLAIDEVGVFSQRPETATLVIDEASGAVVRNSEFAAAVIWVLGGSSPSFENNELVGSGIAIGGEGSNPVIAGNHFAESICANDIPVFWLHDGASPTLEDNVIGSCSGMGIEVDPTAGAIIRRNTIAATGTGIVARSTAKTIIEGNELSDNDVAISITAGSPLLSDNAIAGNTIGFRLSSSATPVLSGNTVCDNETNVRLLANAEMPATAGNDICADAPAA